MKIRIVNPRAGCAKYTSAGQAARYVSRGDAILIGRSLTFLTRAQQRHRKNVEAQIQAHDTSERRRSDVYVDGQVWWNGDIRNALAAMKRPGEVRS